MRIIITITLLLTLSACSLFEANTAGPPSPETEIMDLTGAPPTPPPAKTEPAPVQIESLNDPSAPQIDDIEILWKVPEESVEGFVIHYGNSKEMLDKELRTESSDLERIEHPDFGAVYRYVLKGVSRSDKIFVSVSAFSDTLVSERSDVLEVK